MISCCPRNCQESSLAPQFESINSLTFSLLSGPALTLVHDPEKAVDSNYVDICQQSDVTGGQQGIYVVVKTKALGSDSGSYHFLTQWECFNLWASFFPSVKWGYINPLLKNIYFYFTNLGVLGLSCGMPDL